MGGVEPDPSSEPGAILATVKCLLAALATTITFGCALPAASASASVTIGSNLQANAGEGVCGFGTFIATAFPCATWQASLAPEHTAPGGLTSRINGVITRWRIKFATPGGDLTSVKVQLQPYPGTAGEAEQPFVSLPLANPGTLTVNSRVPISVGESLGVNTLLAGGPEGGGLSFIGSGSGSINYFDGKIVGGKEPSEIESTPGELLVNADIEPDADHDGYGDETQDLCPTDPTTQGPCPDRVSPKTRVSGAGVQDLIKQRTVKLRLTSTESGTGFAEGKLTIAGSHTVFKLVSAEAPVQAGKKTTLRLRLTKRALKATKHALRAHMKVKAVVSVFAKDAAGNASGVTELTVRAASTTRHAARHSR